MHQPILDFWFRAIDPAQWWRVDPAFDDLIRSRFLGDIKAAQPDAIVMHPGPMNRGLEISSAAADSARSTVLEQVSNGVAVRMAALYLLLAGDREGER